MWYWYLALFLLGGSMVLLLGWLNNKKINLKWYEWAIGIIALLLMMFTLQNIVAAYQEGVPGAMGLFALILGIPALILFLVDWQLVQRRVKKE
ncbi:MAG: dehalogenase [Dehalococcoides mccartyi]|jgi:hypothetical protein|uniref:Reductive dehalogenase anchoring protein n=1 Tax=Dehalococcoides mccartyi TaxID=61435 RepID=A0AB33HRF9_9CHLR|nr:dehalogenase [Dehalococcoides mccartyi]MDP4279479.1 dehalogenase [Dehalococcoides mccartyi]BAZ96833.1 Reductive dehalogenase anchoring protein [Dehalococcoides mccartyi]